MRSFLLSGLDFAQQKMCVPFIGTNTCVVCLFGERQCNGILIQETVFLYLHKCTFECSPPDHFYVNLFKKIAY